MGGLQKELIGGGADRGLSASQGLRRRMGAFDRLVVQGSGGMNEPLVKMNLRKMHQTGVNRC